MQNTKEKSLVVEAGANSVAAGLAVFPPYYLFAVKSALQADMPRPPMNLTNTLFWPLKGMWIAGGIMGLQFTLTAIAEQQLKEQGVTGFYADTASALGVAAVSIGPLAAVSIGPLAADNGRTFGLTVMESVTRICRKQAGALIIRESTFLCGKPMGDLISRNLVNKFGDSKLTKYSSSFIGGALVCFLGYPADTALTRLQHGLPPVSLMNSFRGAQYKCLAMGSFYCFYEFLRVKIVNSR